MTRKLNFSYSKLDAFNKCQWKYKLRYEDYIVPQVPIRWPLVTGVAFHDAVDRMYAAKDFDRKFLFSIWKDCFDMAIETEGGAWTVIDADERDKHFKYGFGLLSAFHKFAAAKGYLKPPLYSEWPFTLELDKYRIKGKIDLIFPNNENIEILDFKTSWTPLTKKVVDKDKQLTIYHWAVSDLLKLEGNLKPGLFYPRKEKIVFTTRKHNSKDSIISEFDSMAETIASGSYKPDYNHCSKCEFKNYCKFYKKVGCNSGSDVL